MNTNRISNIARTKNGMQIRWLLRRDLPGISEVDAKSFPTCMESKKLEFLMVRRGTIGLVAILLDEITQEEFIAGFLIYDLEKDRIKVRRMAVHPNCRRIGVGKELLNKVLKKESPKRSYIEFVLRESNLDAQLFLKAQNFKATRVVRNKYRDTSEDGYIMKHSFQKTLVYEGAF